jgi:hypothetical protein
VSRLEILLAGGRTAWAPGERMDGIAAWRCERAPRRLELRLMWRVHTRAGDEVSTSELSVIEDGTASGERPFALRLPIAPFSYRGADIRIDWLLELIDVDARVAARVELVIGPGGEAVVVTTA